MITMTDKHQGILVGIDTVLSKFRMKLRFVFLTELCSFKNSGANQSLLHFFNVLRSRLLFLSHIDPPESTLIPYRGPNRLASPGPTLADVVTTTGIELYAADAIEGLQR